MGLIAEREGNHREQWKRWAKILDAFVALALAIAPCIPPSSSRLMVSVAIRHVSGGLEGVFGKD